jgi:hypothetical protein
MYFADPGKKNGDGDGEIDVTLLVWPSPLIKGVVEFAVDVASLMSLLHSWFKRFVTFSSSTTSFSFEDPPIVATFEDPSEGSFEDPPSVRGVETAELSTPDVSLRPDKI